MKYVIFFLSSVFLVCGCSTNEDRVRDAILSYTNSVVEMYSYGESVGAESVIAQKQIERLKQRVHSFDQMQISLKPALRSIRIDRVDLASDKVASAVGSESWDFRYVRSKTGKELRKVSVDFTMHYVVEKVNERWLVTDADVEAPVNNGIKPLNPFVELPVDMVPPGARLTTDELLRNSVLAYLKLLAEGYKNQDMTPLYHSATKRRAMKAFYHMSSMGEGQVKMDPELLGIEFVEAKQLLDNSAQVISSERWKYIYYSTQTGEKVYENNASYTLTYDLIKEKGNRWLVDDITIERIEEGEEKGELPFFTRSHDTPAGSDK